MINQRPLSFTDDSTEVTHMDERPRTSKPQRMFTFGLEPATSLVKLRRIQSTSYQKLFQSKPFTVQTTWPIMCEAIHEMGQWYSSSLTNVSQALRIHSRCEILYSNVLMLTPPNWLDNLPTYGKALVLQYALEYSDSIHSAINDVSEGFGFYTSHDLLRASFVAQRFVTLLMRDYELFLSAFVPSLSPAAPGSVASPDVAVSGPSLSLPPLSKNSNSGQLARIYESLERFETAIDYFCLKYGYTDSLHEYQMSSRSLKQNLEEWTRSST